jgi:chorismate lyase
MCKTLTGQNDCTYGAQARACGTIGAAVNSLSHKPEPLWQPLYRYRQAELPTPTRQWLLDQGSLTDHLIRASCGQFRVQRLSQRWLVPNISEQRLLSMQQRQIALIREVVLLCHDTPWVFARSVIPLATLQGPLRFLRQLQSQSLGSLLFRHSNLGRSPFELAKITKQNSYLPSDLETEQAAWGRRSRFTVSQHHLLVSEVFLPDFQPWPQRKYSV